MMCQEKLREVDTVSVRSPHIENETNSSLDLEQRTCHVYTEIAENGTESSNVSVGYGCKSHVSSNTESSTAMGKDVVYMNTKSQLI